MQDISQRSPIAAPNFLKLRRCHFGLSIHTYYTHNYLHLDVLRSVVFVGVFIPSLVCLFVKNGVDPPEGVNTGREYLFVPSKF